MMFYRGIIIHPDNPLPAEEVEQATIQWHSGRTSSYITGQIYTDGACAPHKIWDLSRAAAGVAMIDEAGNKAATSAAPVPRHPPPNGASSRVLRGKTGT